MKKYGIVTKGLVVLVGAALISTGVFLGKEFFFKKSEIDTDDIQNSDTNEITVMEDIGEVKPPNIILILTDDMGYGDISSFGATVIKTPNIDALAQNGASMTNYYAPSHVCSPSRASILTGRYPVRSVNDVLFQTNEDGTSINSVPGIPQEEILISEALKENGYATGMLGKWHLGDTEGYLPNDNGFDMFYGALHSNDMLPYAIYRNREIELESPANQDVLTKNFTNEAIDFIEANAENPFFLYYAQPFPHDPPHASDEFKGSSDAGIYGDSIQEIDWSVGQIVETLKDQGIYNNTLIIFTSDNGPWFEGSTGGLRGRKGQVFSGGQRVPFIAHWPQIIPAGLNVEAISMGIDIFPTIMEMSKISLPDDRIIDGMSIVPLLTGQSELTPHEQLFFFEKDQVLAVTDGTWKYQREMMSDISKYHMLNYGPYLFNLQIDSSESYNLIMNEPELADDFEKKIQSMERKLKMNKEGWK